MGKWGMGSGWCGDCIFLDSGVDRWIIRGGQMLFLEIFWSPGEFEMRRMCRSKGDAVSVKG